MWLCDASFVLAFGIPYPIQMAMATAGIWNLCRSVDSRHGLSFLPFRTSVGHEHDYDYDYDSANNNMTLFSLSLSLSLTSIMIHISILVLLRERKEKTKRTDTAKPCHTNTRPHGKKMRCRTSGSIIHITSHPVSAAKGGLPLGFVFPVSQLISERKTWKGKGRASFPNTFQFEFEWGSWSYKVRGVKVYIAEKENRKKLCRVVSVESRGWVSLSFVRSTRAEESRLRK